MRQRVEHLGFRAHHSGPQRGEQRLTRPAPAADWSGGHPVGQRPGSARGAPVAACRPAAPAHPAIATACSLAACSVSRSSDEPGAGRLVTMAMRVDEETRSWPTTGYPGQHGEGIAAVTFLTWSIGPMLKRIRPAAPTVQCAQEMLARMHLMPSSILAWQGGERSSAREGHYAPRFLSYHDRHRDLVGARSSRHDSTTP
jgi:hypothetical protein